MIQASYTISEQEYLEAQALYLRSTGGMRKLRLFGAIVVVSVTCVVLTNLHNLSVFLNPKVVPAVLVLLSLFFVPLLQRRALRKRYRVEQPGLRDVQLVMDETGYHAKVANQGQGEILWSAFTSYGETESLFVLFKAFAFYAVPKRVLSESQLRELESLIKSQLPKLNPKLAKAQGR